MADPRKYRKVPKNRVPKNQQVSGDDDLLTLLAALSSIGMLGPSLGDPRLQGVRRTQYPGAYSDPNSEWSPLLGEMALPWRRHF